MKLTEQGASIVMDGWIDRETYLMIYNVDGSKEKLYILINQICSYRT